MAYEQRSLVRSRVSETDTIHTAAGDSCCHLQPNRDFPECPPEWGPEEELRSRQE